MKLSFISSFLLLTTFFSLQAQHALILGEDDRVKIDSITDSDPNHYGIEKIRHAIGYIRIVEDISDEPLVFDNDQDYNKFISSLGAGYSQLNRESDSGCTGTIINRKFVLTAAHCLVNKNGRRYNPREVSFFPSFNDKNKPLNVLPISFQSQGKKITVPQKTHRIDSAEVESVYVPQQYVDYQLKCKTRGKVEEDKKISIADHDLCYGVVHPEVRYDFALIKLRENVKAEYTSVHLAHPGQNHQRIGLNNNKITRQVTAIGYPVDLKDDISLEFFEYSKSQKDWVVSSKNYFSNPAYISRGESAFTHGGIRLHSNQVDLAQQMSGGPWIDDNGRILGVSSMMAIHTDIESGDILSGISVNYARAIDMEAYSMLTSWMAKNP